jgi:hypothetical protein
MLRCRLVENPDELARCSTAWSSLAEKGESGDIFGTFGFTQAWWRAYGGSRRLHLILVEEESSSEIRLIAPLYSERSAPGVRRRIGDTQADYENLLYGAGDTESLGCFFSWLRGQRNWHLLLLKRVPEHGTVLNYYPHPVEPATANRGKALSWLDVRNPLVYRRWERVHPIIRGEALVGLRDLLSERFYRKRMGWLSRRGRLTYRWISKPEECLSRLDDFMHMHITEWSKKGLKSAFLEADHCRFYRFLVEELGPCGAIRMDVLSLDDRMVACHFGFTWNGLPFRIHLERGHLLLQAVLRPCVFGPEPRDAALGTYRQLRRCRKHEHGRFASGT